MIYCCMCFTPSQHTFKLSHICACAPLIYEHPTKADWNWQLNPSVLPGLGTQVLPLGKSKTQKIVSGDVNGVLSVRHKSDTVGVGKQGMGGSCIISQQLNIVFINVFT